MSESVARLAAVGPDGRGAERGRAVLSDRAAERLAVVLAVLAAVAAVLAPRRGPVGLADLVLAVAALGLAPRLRRAPLPVPVAWCGSAWVTAAAVSATVALLGRGVERPGLVLLTVLRQAEVVVALALGALAGAARGRDALRGSLLLAVAVAGACGLAQQLYPGIYLPGLSGERAMRSFERGFYVAEANHFAGVFALALPIGLALVVGRVPGPLRRVALVALPLAAAGLATTGSRTGLAAAAAGLLAAVAVSGRRAWLAAGGVALVVAVAFPSGFIRRLQAVADLVTGGAAARSAFADRAVNWGVALDGFRAQPLLGLGPGARAMGFYDSELLLALEGGGALGLAALAGFAFSLWLAVRGRERPGETGALVAVLVLGIAMVSLHAARVALPFALILGAALGETSACSAVSGARGHTAAPDSTASTGRSMRRSNTARRNPSAPSAPSGSRNSATSVVLPAASTPSIATRTGCGRAIAATRSAIARISASRSMGMLALWRCRPAAAAAGGGYISLR